jgi:hypothetical protein
MVVLLLQATWVTAGQAAWAAAAGPQAPHCHSHGRPGPGSYSQAGQQHEHEGNYTGGWVGVRWRPQPGLCRQQT